MTTEESPVALDPSIAFWLEMAEALAYGDAYAAAAARPDNPTGAVTMTIGGATAIAVTAIDFGFFNRVIGLGTNDAAVKEDVEAASQFFLDNGRAQSVIHVAPDAQPAELAWWLDSYGYIPGARWMKTWHDLQDLEPPDPQFHIDRIDQAQAAAFAEVSYTAFGVPPELNDVASATVGRPGWVHYLGYEDDAPVATGAMRVVAGVAWIGYGATLEDHRGFGWQTAMLLRRLHDAREIGAWLAVSETGEETEKYPVNHSYRNMLRTGFRPAYARQNWVRLPSA
jgi:hypothetical protein